MIQFFRDLLSGKENTPGSKRFTSIWSLLLFTIQVVVHLITKFNVQGEILIATVSLILIPLGLNAITAIQAMSSKSQVASDIVKEDASTENTEAAQEVLKSDKPNGN